MEDLEVYDNETRSVLEENLAISRENEKQRIEKAVEIAMNHKAKNNEA